MWWHLSILTSSTINAVMRLTSLSPKNSKRSLFSTENRMQLVACARSALVRVGMSRARGWLEVNERWFWRLDRPVAVDGAILMSASRNGNVQQLDVDNSRKILSTETLGFGSVVRTRLLTNNPYYRLRHAALPTASLRLLISSTTLYRTTNRSLTDSTGGR